MGTVIDTSIFAAHERQQLDLTSRLRDLSDDVAIAAVTAAELIHGIEREVNPKRAVQRGAWLEQILSTIPILVFDLRVARVYGKVLAELSSVGNVPPAHDLMIGVTAIAHGFKVATRNPRDFERIPGLEVDHWK